MIVRKNLEDLKISLSIKTEKLGVKHIINKKAPLLPFSTREPERAKFVKGFQGVLGEFTRLVSGNKLKMEVNLEELIGEISKSVDVSKQDKSQFEQILRTFLQDSDNTIKIFHLHLFQYLPLSESADKKGEKEIARFLLDVLLDEKESVKEVFGKSDSTDLMSRLVLKQLNHLENDEKERRPYVNQFPFVSKLFQEDFKFLAEHKDYFRTHYHLFLSYYYFLYITQLTLKLSQVGKANFNENNEVYFTLDWESTSKNRKGYTHGYQMIKDTGRHLLLHINCLEHLNFLMGVEKAVGYPELKVTYQQLSNEDKEMFLGMLRDWIIEHRKYSGLRVYEEDLVLEYDTLVQYLFRNIKEVYEKSTMLGSRNRYFLSIEEIGKKYFLKTRGSLGYMLNISQDMLLLLTALSLKKERKPLKQVFIDLEARGLFFDRYSKEEIVQLFDKLNLIDKKSDSGDAQYVKPIL
ncbi:DNA phosphorothioation-dependent restriction protein DptG [Bacillus cereus]|uniref:DNA phosphorothioation-dependent restriction protein DptG n=1 Tax=Bacillus thuringiensis TaxID=1428 RepID=A0AAW9JAV4_BACTU|nr:MULTISPECIES: DNA phosphorothioation-dependent restriction protein DptG [Bacillus cereus group]MCU4936985.1 DNA phosphorothioation-dependent restriction protein DptG [Bacillus cereus]MCU5185458.1 DNA phosphorothioation-dependent restriction protein DptG [Bacillus cereus]MDZ5477788.1 DNA phosphorothioation-dependent restriction protein DptG [Bacillus thuringiensis]MRB35888.1 DNA phosphorothioation-dependent restriction protein DptG [Bacillus thuringiensis]TKH84938.1 DNA phosphorothioation-de